MSRVSRWPHAAFLIVLISAPAVSAAENQRELYGPDLRSIEERLTNLYKTKNPAIAATFAQEIAKDYAGRCLSRNDVALAIPSRDVSVEVRQAITPKLKELATPCSVAPTLSGYEFPRNPSAPRRSAGGNGVTWSTISIGSRQVNALASSSDLIIGATNEGLWMADAKTSSSWHQLNAPGLLSGVGSQVFNTVAVAPRKVTIEEVSSVVFAGGDFQSTFNILYAGQFKRGKIQWSDQRIDTGQEPGKVFALAISNDSVFVSTDTGLFVNKHHAWLAPETPSKVPDVRPGRNFANDVSIRYEPDGVLTFPVRTLASDQQHDPIGAAGPKADGQARGAFRRVKDRQWITVPGLRGSAQVTALAADSSQATKFSKVYAGAADGRVYELCPPHNAEGRESWNQLTTIDRSSIVGPTGPITALAVGGGNLYATDGVNVWWIRTDDCSADPNKRSPVWNPMTGSLAKQTLPFGEDSVSVSALAVFNGQLFAGTSRDIYVTSLPKQTASAKSP